MRLFPRKCTICRERAVHPVTTAYTAEMGHDGRTYTVTLPDLDILHCERCGALVLTDVAYTRLSEALRRLAGLLHPAEIRRQREALGLTLEGLANRLGVAEATLARWESGDQLPPRSLDRFLRVFFAFENVRLALADDRPFAAVS